MSVLKEYNTQTNTWEPVVHNTSGKIEIPLATETKLGGITAKPATGELLPAAIDTSGQLKVGTFYNQYIHKEPTGQIFFSMTAKERGLLFVGISIDNSESGEPNYSFCRIIKNGHELSRVSGYGNTYYGGSSCSAFMLLEIGDTVVVKTDSYTVKKYLNLNSCSTEKFIWEES